MPSITVGEGEGDAVRRGRNAGFTMAELLIVVAIVAVLVAIAIPVFNSQLEKSRESTDLANVRSAYAQVMSAAITADTQAQYEGQPIYNSTNSTYQVQVPLKQKKAGWESYPVTIAEVTVTEAQPNNARWVGAPIAGGSCTVSYNATGGVVFTWGGAREGIGVTNNLFLALQKFFVTDKKYDTMTSWDTLYPPGHNGIKALKDALKNTGVVSCSVINTLHGKEGNILNSATKLDVSQEQYNEMEKHLYYLWTSDRRAADTSLQGDTSTTTPVMVARTNATGIKEYAVIETNVLRGNVSDKYSSYNALSSCKDESGAIKRPKDADYDINKLLNGAVFSTDYNAIKQQYDAKLSFK